MYFVRVLGIRQVTNEVLLFQYTKVTQAKAKIRNSWEKEENKWGGEKKEIKSIVWSFLKCRILEKRKTREQERNKDKCCLVLS